MAYSHGLTRTDQTRLMEQAILTLVSERIPLGKGMISRVRTMVDMVDMVDIKLSLVLNLYFFISFISFWIGRTV